MAASDNEAVHYAEKKTARIMALVALRRLRLWIKQGRADEAAIRVLTWRALLWFLVIVLSIPLLLFCKGAAHVYLEYREQGRPFAAFLDRFYSEVGDLFFWLVLWTISTWALVKHHRIARRAKDGDKGT